MVAQFVEALADEAALLGRDRRFVHERGIESVGERRRHAERLRLLRERRGAQAFREARQATECIAQAAEIAWRRLGTGDAGRETFQIGQAAQRLAEGDAQALLAQPGGDRRLTGDDRVERSERTFEPAAQTTSARRGHGEIEVGPQRVRRLPTRLRREQFEMARRGRVVAEHGILAPALDARHLRGDATLRAVEVVQGGDRGRQRQR